MTLGIHALRLSLAEAPDQETPAVTEGWRPRFGSRHTVAMSGLLLVLSGSWPWLGSHAGSGLSAGILLVVGALIGITHGASDFPVAHRLLKRVLGRAWLVVFVLAYLTLVLAVLLAWWLAPLATLIVFLAVSSLHFAG